MKKINKKLAAGVFAVLGTALTVVPAGADASSPVVDLIIYKVSCTHPSFPWQQMESYPPEEAVDAVADSCRDQGLSEIEIEYLGPWSTIDRAQY